MALSLSQNHRPRRRNTEKWRATWEGIEPLPAVGAAVVRS
jgi:hypothetical protein